MSSLELYKRFLVKLNPVDFHFNHFFVPYGARFVKRTMFVDNLYCMVKHNKISRICFSYTETRVTEMFTDLKKCTLLHFR